MNHSENALLLCMYHCSSDYYYHLQSQAACWVTQVHSELAMNQALVQIGSCETVHRLNVSTSMTHTVRVTGINNCYNLFTGIQKSNLSIFF